MSVAPASDRLHPEASDLVRVRVRVRVRARARARARVRVRDRDQVGGLG